MSKSSEAFRTIREVADWLGVAAHVLRFWESKFTQIKPVKRAGGRRYYRPADMELVGGIKVLLHDRGMTIRGVQKMIREDGVASVTALSPPVLIEAETRESGTDAVSAWASDAAIDSDIAAVAGDERSGGALAKPETALPQAQFSFDTQEDPGIAERAENPDAPAQRRGADGGHQNRADEAGEQGKPPAHPPSVAQATPREAPDATGTSPVPAPDALPGATVQGEAKSEATRDPNAPLGPAASQEVSETHDLVAEAGGAVPPMALAPEPAPDHKPAVPTIDAEPPKPQAVQTPSRDVTGTNAPPIGHDRQGDLATATRSQTALAMLAARASDGAAPGLAEMRPALLRLRDRMRAEPGASVG